jgi:hypothetical protein
MKAIQVTHKYRNNNCVNSEIIGYFDTLVEAKEYIKNIPFRIKSFTRIIEGGKVKRYKAYTCKKVILYTS